MEQNDPTGQPEEPQATIEQQIQALETILFHHDPFNMIAHIALANAPEDVETYKEYEHNGSDIYTEYVTLLYLSKPLGYYAAQNKEEITWELVQEVQSRVERVFSTLIDSVMYVADPLHPTSDDALKQLRSEALTRSLLVRYPGFQHHLIEILTSLFSPLQDQLVAALGFTISDALTLIQSIERLIQRRIEEQRKERREYEKQLRTLVKKKRLQSKRRKKQTSKIGLDALTEELALLRPKEAAGKIQAIALRKIITTFGQAFSFTSEELASEASIEQGRTRAFLEKMSLTFGEVDPILYRLPSATHPLLTKPIIHQEDRYFCPVFQSLYWSLRPALQSFLNPSDDSSLTKNKALWERYTRIRAEYLEKKALEYLSKILRPEHAYHKLKYWVDEQGISKETELDGLLLVDSALFLVEAKAGSLSTSARRGAPQRILRDVDELVGKAYSQALRAKRYLQETPHPFFSLSDGTAVQISKPAVKHIFLITISLDPLDAFVTNLPQLRHLGYFPEGVLPWAVSLTDLRVMSELLEFSSQFVHYLQQRQKINERGNVRTYEELDWFGHYLLATLRIEEDEKVGLIYLSTHTTFIEEYYLYTTGQRTTPAPKPTQMMPDILRQCLSVLEATRPSGYLRAACMLLGIPFEAFHLLVENVRQEWANILKARNTYDFYVACNIPDTDVTWVFTSNEHFTLLERMRTYCKLKKYQAKSDLWLGIGCIVDTERLVQKCFVFNYPWTYDEEMEKQVSIGLPALGSFIE